MPNYDELIKQSQKNVESLAQKLNDIDKLYNEITEIKESAKGIPVLFEKKFQQIVSLSEEYTKTLGISTKTYLDGNNTMIVDNLNGLKTLIDSFETEVVRLIETDFTSLFDDLQKAFIHKTKADIEIELKKFDEKVGSFQSAIDSLKKEVERLNGIDLEKLFDKHQKTLADIFGAINSINLTLTNITQGLSGIAQSISYIEASITSNFKETNQQIASFDKRISDQLEQQSETRKNTIKLFEEKISSLSNQNELLKKEINTNRIIQIIGFILVVIAIIYFK